MSGQPSVLQVVILRDGLLVGTEVFVPGTYALGSGPSADLRLDDPSVEPRHALLYFQNGRAAIQDAGSALGVFVNGHRVSACEIRSVDEVLCGPFVLKTRVLAQRPQEAKPQPPPEVAALLGAPPPPSVAPVPTPVPLAPQQSAPVRQLRPAAPAQPLAATVPGVRATPQAPAAGQPAARLVPSPAAPQPELLSATVPGNWPTPAAARPTAVTQAAYTAPTPVPLPVPPAAPAPQPASVPAGTMPSVRRRATQEAQAAVPGLHLADDLLADVGLDSLPEPTGPLVLETRPATRPTHAPRMGPGKGAPQLYLELYWGAVRRDARRFAPDRKRPVLASLHDDVPQAMPLWGFTLPDNGGPFALAETVNGSFRVYVPPGTDVEKSGNDGRFAPVTGAALESDGSRRFLTLRDGTAARLSQGQMSLVAYAAPKPERVFVNPLKGLPWLSLACFSLFGGALAAFLAFMPDTPETADFTQKSLP
ncbi:MAG TPA: FHA domain-containing protein, partial [Myxococcus sp.]|nr:FHA domain-containing protein [Myxococcus sp.]